jgi:hypothetical protein
MAEQAEAKEQARPAASGAASMADTINVLKVADSLRLMQEQAAIEAMKLPDKRLDDAGPDGGATPYTLRDDGNGNSTKVNSEGQEVNDQGEVVQTARR